MWAELGNISRKLPGSVRVVIVQGEGRAFSAGLDLSVARGEGDSSLARLAQLSPAECADRIAGFQSAFTWLRNPSLVTIAAVRGHAIGAGFQLALNCDMRVLADDARLSMAEVTLGLVPDLGGTKRLAELVGPSRALEICLTGRRIAADEADRIGLATDGCAGRRSGRRGRRPGRRHRWRPTAMRSPRSRDCSPGSACGRTQDQDRAEREAQTRRLRELAGVGE